MAATEVVSPPSARPHAAERSVVEEPAVRKGRSSFKKDRASAKRATHRWARWLHVYTSMVALVLTLFFGLTGITLNHPSWTFGDASSRETITGTLGFDVDSDGDGVVDFLPVAESVRSEHDVRGTVDSFGEAAGQGSIAFENPGYSADLFFDVDTGDYELVVEQQGWVAVMNDLHKGRSSGSAWGWVIDLSAGFLVLISITGLVMQFFLRKRRTSALTVAVAGGMVSIVLMLVTLA